MNHQLLGRSGLRVSDLCLGTMTFGTEWGWGSDEAESKAVFDAFVQAGGTFIDTANRYTEGTSEKWVGKFIHADRDHFVLATKYSLHDRLGDLNFAGNHRKNLVRSVNESLRRLDTDYIDLLWVHAWDFVTPEDEVMRGLEDLVRAGKVHYIGISDTPAWVVSRCNTLAELRGWTQFVGLQVEYSLLQRAPERDLIPMSEAFGMTLTPWAPLAGGALTGKYLGNNDDPKRLKEDSTRLNDRNTEIARLVVNIAQELGHTPAQVALNWVRQKSDKVIPIIGARKVSQLADSLGCLSFALPKEYMSQLDEASAIDLGFPHDFLQSDGVKRVLFAGESDKLKR